MTTEVSLLGQCIVTAGASRTKSELLYFTVPKIVPFFNLTILSLEISEGKIG